MSRSDFDNYSHKIQQFVKGNFYNWAHNQGLNMADQTLTLIIKNVQEKFFSENMSVDTLPAIDVTADIENISDIDMTDMAVDSVTNNSLWLLEKSSEIASSVKNFINGDISRADCIKQLVTTTSAFVGKIVKSVTIVALGLGNVITLGFLPIPVEWVGNLTGIISSKLFCMVFQPLINHLRKEEAYEIYECLHGFYEASINELRRQRELFECATSELFSHRKVLIDDCMKKLNLAFTLNDGDEISEVLSHIAKEFGGELKFKNFEEFDAFMLSDEELEF